MIEKIPCGCLRKVELRGQEAGNIRSLSGKSKNTWTKGKTGVQQKDVFLGHGS